MIHNGDCLEVMQGMAASSVDAIVTDPPYGLGFMGKNWDHGVPGIPFWEAALRVAKPGAHLLAFGGTRTFHRLACAIEDAGWELRDTIMWVYGSGFPKSLDVSKAIDKASGAVREVGPLDQNRAGRLVNQTGEYSTDAGWSAGSRKITIDPPATEAAKQWQGWGTALKPSHEPVIVARKPLAGTVAANVQRYGTGALNIDGCRVGTSGGEKRGPPSGEARPGTSFAVRNWKSVPLPLGRWPANLIHDGSEEVVGLFPETGVSRGRRVGTPSNGFGMKAQPEVITGKSDSGSAARFFYCAKASKRDRDEGCERFVPRFAPTMGNGIGGKEHDPETATPKRNFHPTVKPTDLMRYLCRLVTPPGGTVLDPFAGSGSTGKACALEGFQFIGIEREAEYVEIARARIAAVEKDLFAGAV